jgi:hypothetical protein
VTDEEVAEYAHITVEQAGKLRRVAPNHIIAFERMREFARQWDEFNAGRGPRPTGILIDEDY